MNTNQSYLPSDHDDCDVSLAVLKEKLFSKRTAVDLFLIEDSYAENGEILEIRGSLKATCGFSYDVVSEHNRKYSLVVRLLAGHGVEIRIELRSHPVITNLFPTIIKISEFEDFDSQVARMLTELFASEI